MKRQLTLLILLIISPLSLWSQTARPPGSASTSITTQTPYPVARPPAAPARANSPYGVVPPGMTNQFVGTNAFGTNGMAGLPEDVILLARDLQINVQRLYPLLALVTGVDNSMDTGGDINGSFGTTNQVGQNFGTVNGTNVSSPSAGQNFSSSAAVTPGAPPTPPAPTFPSPASPSARGTVAGVTGTSQLGANELAVLNNLQLVLQDAQVDIQELLPRLAQITGRAGFQNNAGGVGNQFGTNSAGFGRSPTNASGRPLNRGFGAPPAPPQPGTTRPAPPPPQ
jgi:hypothetical protein